MYLLKRVSMLAVTGVAVLFPVSAASIFSLTGSLDPANSNDTFVFGFSIANPTGLAVQSYGYGGTSATASGTNVAGNVVPAGGFDTYLSLFTGIGPTATFLASNDDGTCPPAATVQGNCRDSRLSGIDLGAGKYTLVLSVTNNYSLAENYGYGTLGDGFTNLAPQNYYDAGTGTDRTSNWALDFFTNGRSGITPIPAVTSPEPAAYLFTITGLALIALGTRRTKRS